MNKPMLSKDKKMRLTFCNYAMHDAIILHQIWTQRIKEHNDMLQDCLGFKSEYQINPSYFPSTVAKLIAMTFENFIYNEASRVVDINAFKVALYKIGHLNPKLKDYKEKHLVNRYKILSDADIYKTNKSLVESHCTFDIYLFNGLNSASIPYLNTMDRKSFIQTSALVTGARCHKERYQEIRKKNIFDFDFTSCYGSALVKLDYPIGIPRTYACHINKKGETLRHFLKQRESQLIPGFYKIVVVGKLPFDQDLVYSKAYKERNMDHLYSGTLDNTQNETLTDHVLLKREIYNGVITHDILKVIRKVIRKVSSAKELHFWLNLDSFRKRKQ